MKGFAEAMILIGALIVAAILLSVSFEEVRITGEKNAIMDTKNQISNFNILINTSAQYCDWVTPGSAKSCIDSNAASLITMLNANSSAKCTASGALPNLGKYYIDLNCFAQVSGGKIDYWLLSSKKIEVAKR